MFNFSSFLNNLQTQTIRWLKYLVTRTIRWLEQFAASNNLPPRIIRQLGWFTDSDDSQTQIIGHLKHVPPPPPLTIMKSYLKQTLDRFELDNNTEPSLSLEILKEIDKFK